MGLRCVGPDECGPKKFENRGSLMLRAEATGTNAFGGWLILEGKEARIELGSSVTISNGGQDDRIVDVAAFFGEAASLNGTGSGRGGHGGSTGTQTGRGGTGGSGRDASTSEMRDAASGGSAGRSGSGGADAASMRTPSCDKVDPLNVSSGSAFTITGHGFSQVTKVECSVAKYLGSAMSFTLSLRMATDERINVLAPFPIREDVDCFLRLRTQGGVASCRDHLHVRYSRAP